MNLTLATRRSPLALVQSRAFAAALARAVPGLEITELQVVTSGDKMLAGPLQDLGGKGLFTKELEEALLRREADFAVHSLKDVPAVLDQRLTIACIPRREDPRDVLVSRSGAPLRQLPPAARVGTSSMRRALSLRRVRPDLRVEIVRGNVDTRLRKVREGELEAVVLARAGLIRLGLEGAATEILDADVMLPACGQGALAAECRADDEAAAVLQRLADPETTLCVAAERAFLLAVEGNCRLPVAAHAVREGDSLWLRGLLAEPDGTGLRTGERRIGWPASEAEVARAGRELGHELRRVGAPRVCA